MHILQVGFKLPGLLFRLRLALPDHVEEALGLLELLHVILEDIVGLSQFPLGFGLHPLRLLGLSLCAGLLKIGSTRYFSVKRGINQCFALIDQHTIIGEARSW